MPPTRLLVVEDNAEVRFLLRAHLAAAGYEVEEAADGAEALDRVRVEPPEVMVVDVAMPIMDGAELVEAIRLDASLPVIPVLVYSGRPHTDERITKLLRFPAVAYEVKGNPRRVPEAVAELLNTRSAKPAAR